MIHFFGIWFLLFVWTLLVFLAIDSRGEVWALWVARLMFLVILPLILLGNLAALLKGGWRVMLDSLKSDWRAFKKGDIY